MKLRKVIRGRALYTEKNRIWIAQGMTFLQLIIEGKVTPNYNVGTEIESLLGNFRLSRTAFSSGPASSCPIDKWRCFCNCQKNIVCH